MTTPRQRAEDSHRKRCPRIGGPVVLEVVPERRLRVGPVLVCEECGWWWMPDSKAIAALNLEVVDARARYAELLARLELLQTEGIEETP